eukprot:m51a1_g6101 hypothetical protein (790) ;mRNA; r:72381-75504
MTLTWTASLVPALLLARAVAASCSGKCADINGNTCSTGFVSGLCPGPSNIQCCTGQLCPGRCASTDEYTCSSGFKSGLCAGADNVQCCSGILRDKSTSCSGTCADVMTSTCSTSFVSGLCRGPWNIKCCEGQLCDGQCASTDEYTCSSGFKSGLCSGPANVQCCSGWLRKKGPRCHGWCADVNDHSCSTGFEPGRCPGPAAVQCCNGELTDKCPGTCADVESNRCSTGFFVRGMCPGGRNIRCCLGTVSPMPVCNGTCADVTENTCSTGFLRGLCPGGWSEQCCTGTVKPKDSCDGTCADTNTNMCSTGFQPGLCPGAANIQCCSGALTPRPTRCAGTCADADANKCSTGFVSGLCPGAASIQCCTGTVTPSGDAGNNPKALAVILGNLQQESNLNPLSCEAYGGPASSLSSCPITLSGSYYLTGVGLLQWSDPDNQPGRRTQLFAYCRAQGLDCDLASTQLQYLAQEDEWARAKECFQAPGKELGTTWDDAGATPGSYWKCAALWTGWGTAGSRADYALQWLARCKDADDSDKCQCADINSNTCSTGFVPGLCPGASNIQCCKGNVTANGGTGSYNRGAAVAYAHKYWNSPNHDCGQSYASCSPYSYWGGEHCGYASQGGDCANFVSQCLLAGGHAPLNDGGPCRGYPCGSEEIGARNLGECLATHKGWTRTCGLRAPPPADIMVGDVLVYHAGSCTDDEAHATIVTAVEGGVRITCHSSEKHDEPYTYLEDSKPYYEWLHTSSYALTDLALNASRDPSAAPSAGPAPLLLCCASACAALLGAAALLL